VCFVLAFQIYCIKKFENIFSIDVADIFTKCLATFQFIQLASQLMGWVSSESDDGQEHVHPSGSESKQMRGSDVGYMRQRPSSLATIKYGYGIHSTTNISGTVDGTY